MTVITAGGYSPTRVRIPLLDKTHRGYINEAKNGHGRCVVFMPNTANDIRKEINRVNKQAQKEVINPATVEVSVVIGGSIENCIRFIDLDFDASMPSYN